MRVGIGYDVHRLVPGRPLILGGASIPYEFGLLGHSDADVLLHAIMDALLGACGLPDIGVYFSDKDPEFAGISSLELLRRVRGIILDAGCSAVNVDSTIIAEEPKMSPYIAEMKINIAAALGLPASAVGVKATTEEGLGFTGKGEGIAAQAVCCVEENKK